MSALSAVKNALVGMSESDLIALGNTALNLAQGTQRQIEQLHLRPVTFADVLLNRVRHNIDFASLDRAEAMLADVCRSRGDVILDLMGGVLTLNSALNELRGVLDSARPFRAGGAR
jgi:hypothetical protein